jgi:hypothetical protein
MKNFLRILAASALAVQLWSPAPVFAAASTVNQQRMMCQNDVTGASSGARTIGGTLSAVPSGSIYTLNGSGCTLVAVGDVAYFLSQGFAFGAQTGMIQYAGLTSASSATSVLIGTLPQGAVIQSILLAETAGAAITGGVAIGTTSSGTNIVTAQALGANGLLVVADASVTKIIGSTGTTLANPVYATCVTSCNAGSVTISIIYWFM